jgi:hypothetical protein
MDGAYVVDVVSTRVGMSDFFLHLEALRQNPLFKQALAPPKPAVMVVRGGELEEGAGGGGAGASEVAGAEALYDHEFAKWSVAFEKVICCVIGRLLVA